MGWAIGAVAISLIALFFTRTQIGRMMVGALYPATWLAATIIRERLTEQRLNPHLYPISALAHHSVDFAKMQANIRTKPSQKPGEKPWYRIFLLQSAQTTADLVLFVSTGNPSDLECRRD